MQHSSVAAEAWKNMSDADKKPYLDIAIQRKGYTKKNAPKKKKTHALVWLRTYVGHIVTYNVENIMCPNHSCIKYPNLMTISTPFMYGIFLFAFPASISE
jgi:hypothetical protein